MNLAPVVQTRISPDGRVWTAAASGAWDLIGFVADETLGAPGFGGLALALDRADALQAMRRYTDSARLYAALEESIRWFDADLDGPVAAVVLV